MKLYIYQHCPFCARVLMLINTYNLPVEIDFLLNDDVAKPVSLIGVKQVPILVFYDGMAMGESLDITRYLINKYAINLDLERDIDDDLRDIITYISPLVSMLVVPRFVTRLLPEFTTIDSRDHYVTTKEEYLGSFKEKLANTSKYIEELKPHLDRLDDYLANKDNILYVEGRDLIKEDILLYPLLRNLTVVDGFSFSYNVKKYYDEMENKTGVMGFYL